MTFYPEKSEKLGPKKCDPFGQFSPILCSYLRIKYINWLKSWITGQQKKDQICSPIGKITIFIGLDYNCAFYSFAKLLFDSNR